MSLKFQRMLWIFSGICFLIGIVFWMLESKPFGIYYVLNGITSILCFINANIIQKKIVN